MARISVAEGMTDALAQPGEPGYVNPEHVADPGPEPEPESPDPTGGPGQDQDSTPAESSPVSSAPKAAKAAPTLSAAKKTGNGA